MTARVVALLLCLGFLGTGPAQAQPLTGTAPRQKPGPVDIRGVAAKVGPRSFELRTLHHGSYKVVTQAATQINEKGQRGAVTLRAGDHVLVRGFLRGRELRAIRIRIYPVKPKPFSLRGTVSSIVGDRITLTSGGRSYSVAIIGQTVIVVGSARGTVGQIHVGDRVLVRVVPSGGRLVALHVHVYKRKVVGRHVRISGTLVSVGGGTLTVQSGTRRYRIGMTGSTVVHRGGSIVGRGALKPGEPVTVYACCVGRPLQATSVHILKTATRSISVEVRGYVVAADAQSLRIRTSASVITIWLSRSTAFEVGSQRVTRNGLRIGDQVTIRAARIGTRLVASRVHVLAASRRPRTIIGVVTAVGRGSVTVRAARGQRYVVSVTSRTAVSPYRQPHQRASIHPGDRVRIRALPSGPGTYVAQRITVRPPVVKTVTVRGTIAAVNGGTLVVVDAAGKRYSVRVPSGVRPRLHGAPAPTLALFPGAHVAVRGRPAGAAIVASSLTLSVRSRTVKGRLKRVQRATLVVATAGGHSARLDVPTGARLRDAGKRIDVGSFHVGAFILATGYVETATATRAVSVSVEHPALDIAAVLVGGGSQPIVQTTAGVRYQLRLVAASQITTSRFHLLLAASDIPTGTHLHVQGTADSTGAIVVAALTVRLESVSLRGRLASVSAGSLSLKSATGTVELRLTSTIAITQGTHSLAPGDLVVGDDVTAEGYRLAGNAILTRRLLVHRRLVAMDGTVGAITASGFELRTAQGDHQVLTSAATALSGSLAPGATVHVTGYLRGDGSILATRVKVGKQCTVST